MYICRLFHRDRPFEQIEARLIAHGRLTIGRDPSVDWPLGEADGALSRLHCTLAVEGERLLMTDHSTNGVYLDNGDRAPKEVAVALEAHQSIRLGPLIILVEPLDQETKNGDSTMISSPPMFEDVPRVPDDWSDGPAARPPHRDKSLLEAFCNGAKLDASAFSAEDPAELMRRVGAIYQQTVLGLATLMAERARVKQAYQLEGTTLGASDNNPFKWSPTRRLAQDLLCAVDGAFLSDAEAVRASFQDLSNHLGAVAQGANAVNAMVMETLAPSVIESEAKAHASLMRSRSTVCWDIHNRRHTALNAKAGGQESPVTRAFGEAYRRAAGEATL